MKLTDPADEEKVLRQYSSWIKNLQIISTDVLHFLFYFLAVLLAFLIYLYGKNVFFEWYALLTIFLWLKAIQKIGHREQHREGYLSGYADGFEDGQWQARGVSPEEAAEYKDMRNNV